MNKRLRRILAALTLSTVAGAIPLVEHAVPVKAASTYVSSYVTYNKNGFVQPGYASCGSTGIGRTEGDYMLSYQAYFNGCTQGNRKNACVYLWREKKNSIGFWYREAQVGGVCVYAAYYGETGSVSGISSNAYYFGCDTTRQYGVEIRFDPIFWTPVSTYRGGLICSPWL